MSGYLAGLECSRCAGVLSRRHRAGALRLRGPLLARYDLAGVRKAVTPDDIARRAAHDVALPRAAAGPRRRVDRDHGRGLHPDDPGAEGAARGRGGRALGEGRGRQSHRHLQGARRLRVDLALEGAGRHPLRPAHRGQRRATPGPPTARARASRSTPRSRSTAPTRLEGQLDERRARLPRRRHRRRRVPDDGRGGRALRLAPRRGRPRALPLRGQEDDGPRDRRAARLADSRTPSSIPPAAASGSSGCGRSSTSWRSSAGSAASGRGSSPCRCRAARVVKAFHEGADECLGARHVDTIAPGIMVVKPFADFLTLRALRATRGLGGRRPRRRRRSTSWVDGPPRGPVPLAGGRGDDRRGAPDGPRRPARAATSRVVVFNTATGLRYPHLMDGPVPVVPGAGAIDDAAVAQAGRAIAGRAAGTREAGAARAARSAGPRPCGATPRPARWRASGGCGGRDAPTHGAGRPPSGGRPSDGGHPATGRPG